MKYDYKVVHRALHRVSVALSRMFEGDTVTPLVSTIETDLGEDNWYQKRFRKITENTKRFSDWQIIDGQLYYLRPRPMVSDVVEDLDR